MIDKPTSDRIAQLHPLVRPQVTQLIAQAQALISPRITIRIVQGLRTIDEQNALYAKGRTTPGPKVTNAKGGSSYHNYGSAIDFAFLIDGKEISWDTTKDWDGDHVADWLEVVQVFIRAGWIWGGNFKSIKDMPHFEHPAFSAIGWRELLRRYEAKDFIAGTKYVRI